MPYVPNATQTTEPVESQTVESAALEFRTLKTRVNALETDLDAVDAGLIAADAAEAATRAAADTGHNTRLTAIENALLTIGEGGLPGTIYVQRFSGNDATTAFVLGVAVPSNAAVDVYINGVYQQKNSFTVVGTALTFDTAPPAGAENIEAVVTITIALGTTTAELVSMANGQTAEAAIADRLHTLPTYAALRLYVGPSDVVWVQERAGGIFYVDATDLASADNDVNILVDASGRRWKRPDRTTVDIRQFGVVADGVTDNATALQAARNYLLANDATLVIPAGVYSYSASPNWNIPQLRMLVTGEVRFRYTGVGNAFIIDDAALVGLFGLYVGPFPIIIEAPATAQNGVYIKSVHHSELHFNVRGAGAAYAGVRVDFAVCTSFPHLTVSNNENGGVQGWYANAKPKYGLYLDKRNAGETASYCLFENPILEGTDKGAYLDNAMGNTFVGGTMEGCTEQGAYLTANAFANKWYGTDFEANTLHDVYCLGRQNQFTDIDTLSLFTFDGTAHDNRVVGGNHNQLSLTATTYGNLVGDLIVNREGAGGTLTDSAVTNRTYNIRDASTGAVYNVKPTATVVGVGASPFTYTNTSINDVEVAVGGGTVSQIVYGRPSVGSALLVGTVGKWRLQPGDTLQVTYTVAPTMVVYSS